MEKMVQSIISCLGYLEKGVYYKEPDCFESIRDLIRFVHNDDSKLTVRRICSSQNIVKNDLVPIMKAKDTTSELFDAVLRLAVNLCQPTLIALNGKVPENNADWQIYYEAERNLVRSLIAFDDPTIFEILGKKCVDYFALEWEDRTEKQKLVVERIFVLIRYVFAIGTESARYIKMPELDGSLRRNVLIHFFRSCCARLFVDLSKDLTEKEFGLHIISILSLAFKNVDVSVLVLKEEEVALKERRETDDKLANLVAETKRHEQSARFGNRRNFMKGNFVLQGVKALNTSNNLVVQNSCLSNESPIEKLAHRKTRRSLPKNRRLTDLEDVNAEPMCRSLNPTLIEAMRHFCTQMIDEGAYDRLMRSTRDLAFANGRSLTHKFSEIYFFTLARVFIQFARFAKISPTKITSTFSVEFLTHILLCSDSYMEYLKTDKGNAKCYALKLQYAVEAFKDLLILLNCISKTTMVEESELFHSICDRIFSMDEFREYAYSLMNSLTLAQTTRKMLQDLVLLNHYYLHIMEKMAKCGELANVKKSKRSRKRRRSSTKENSDENNGEEKPPKMNKEPSNAEEKVKEPPKKVLQETWKNIDEEVKDVLTGKIPMNEDISPIDMLFKVDDEQHLTFAALKVQVALRERRVCDAVGIYRAARTLWPEVNVFGDDTMEMKQESNELKELFFTNMTDIHTVYRRCMREAYGESEENRLKLDKDDDLFDSVSDDGGEKVNVGEEKENNEMADGEAEDEGDEKKKKKRRKSGKKEEDGNGEVPFIFEEFVSNFGKPNVLHWYIFLLKKFDTNSVELNKAILKMMHRIAFDLKSPARLYMATLFYIFKRVNEALERMPEVERRQHALNEIRQFGYHIIRKFLGHYRERGSILICELLFTKTAQDAYRIEHGEDD